MERPRRDSDPGRLLAIVDGMAIGLVAGILFWLLVGHLR
jgi:hypothetical protein